MKTMLQKFMLMLALAAPMAMAAPSVAGYIETSVAAPSTTFQINIPAGLTADEDLIIFTTVKSWTSIGISSPVGCFPMFSTTGFSGVLRSQAFQCDRGRQVGLTTVDAIAGQATELQAVAIRVSGGYAPPGSSMSHKAWQAVSCAKVPKGFSYTFGPPNPPALNPAGWDVEDTLWLEVVANAYSNPIVAYSAGYDDNQAQFASGGPIGLRLAMASRAAAVASEDPAALTATVASPCVAATVAVRPSP